MMRLRFASISCLILAAVTSCSSLPADYCDEMRACPPPQVCDLVRRFCKPAPPPADLAVPPDLFIQRDFAAPPCVANTECTLPAEPICDQTTARCRPCVEQGPAITDAGISSECELDRPTAPYCVRGQCAECRESFDCFTKQKACDSRTRKCVACARNADCWSGLCTKGACNDPASLIYVDGKACPAQGAGTLAEPFCKIQDGLDAGSGGGTIIVRAGTYNESLNIDSQMKGVKATLIGLDLPVIRAAAAGPSVNVRGDDAHQLDVTLDGVVIEKAMMAEGVNCQGGATPARTTFKLIRSVVRENPGAGVTTSNCKLALDRTTVGPGNLGGGISVLGGDVQVTSTLVFKNGSAKGTPAPSAFGGVRVAMAASRAVLFNTTVADNVSGADQVAAGVSCEAMAGLVANSVIYGNTGGARQIDTAPCQVHYNSFVGASVPNQGTNNLDPGVCNEASLFVNRKMNDYHPAKGARAPCTLIDQGAPMVSGETAPAADLDGKMRPQGLAWDFGAFESQ